MSQREHWGSKLGFILAAAGSAVGLGSLWKFPYTVGMNGGGAFILLYILFTFLIGIPVFTAEVIIGRRTQKGAVLAYEALSSKESQWKMLGWVNVIACFIILAFYSVVSGWTLSYILMSLMQFTQGKSVDQIKEVFTTLTQSPGINLLWLFVFLGINVGIVFTGVKKGIEKWSKILMPGLLLILVGLFLYCTTLDGFGKALQFIFEPDFSKLTPKVILNALGLAFFTLSVGLGIILTYGSYLKSTENIPVTSLIIAGTTISVSLIASMMIFPIVFTYGGSPQAGVGLVFQTMPVLFSKMPAEIFLSVIFFSLLLFTAITSSISLLEMLVSNFIEIFKWTRERATIVCALIAFIIGIPCALSYTDTLFAGWKTIYGRDFFETMDFITTGWVMPISGLATTIFVGWYQDDKLYKSEFLKGSRSTLMMQICYFSVRYLAPLAVLLIIFEQAGLLPHFA